jgi:hypothetical protein
LTLTGTSIIRARHNIHDSEHARREGHGLFVHIWCMCTRCYTPLSRTAYCVVRSQKSLKSAHPSSGHVSGVSRGIWAIHRPSVPNKHRPSNGQHRTKPIDCSRPNLEVVKYVVLGAHPRRGRSGAAPDAVYCSKYILRRVSKPTDDFAVFEESQETRRPNSLRKPDTRTREPNIRVTNMSTCILHSK